MNFSGIITLLNEDYFPDCYQKYVFLNFRQSDQYRCYNELVPNYLQGRPREVIIHCLDRKANSAKFCISDVIKADTKEGKFTILGSRGQKYDVCFGSNLNQSPSCSCPDFVEWNIPCKHYFAIFRLFPDWGWNKLPNHYLDGPYMNTDRNAIKSYFDTYTSPAETPEFDSNILPQQQDVIPEKVEHAGSYYCIVENYSVLLGSECESGCNEP